MSRACDLGHLVVIVGDLKYVSSIAEGRALGGDQRVYFIVSSEALFSTVLDGDPRPCEVRAVDRTRRPLPPRHCGAIRQQNYSTIKDSVLWDLLPDGFAMGGMSRARDLGHSERRSGSR